MKHAQTIAMVRGLLAESRARDAARMLEPLLEPVPEQVPDALEDGQLVLRSLLVRLRLLCYGDPVQAQALLRPFDAASAREALPPGVRAEVALWLGWTHTWAATATADPARALHLLGEADRLFRQTLNPAGQCWALMGKARAYFALHEYPLMRRSLREASALEDTAADAQATRWMLDLHTLSAHGQGRYAQALTFAEALHEQARQAGDAFAQGRAGAYQAALYYDLGRLPDAIVATATEAEARLHQAAAASCYPLRMAFEAHIGALLRQGAWDAAEHLIGKALDATADQPAAAAHLLLYRVCLALRRSRLAEAEAQLQAVQQEVHPPQQGLLASRLALCWCALREQQADPSEALTWAEHAYHAAQESGHEEQQLRALLVLARLSQAQGREDDAHRYQSLTRPLRSYFSALPVAALRFSVLGDLALAEDNPDEAYPHFVQALTAYELIGDVYHTARLQARLATLLQTMRPAYARALLDAARHTFARLHADADHAAAQTVLDAWPADTTPAADVDDGAIGAALARASLSVTLIAETWLDAARHLLPDRWMGIYRCDEGHPWCCVRELGQAPAVPNTHEPCGPQLLADDILWLRLRSHPGPAFFFGVALSDPDDPAWRAARTRMKPWMPVATLALDHALLRAEQLNASATDYAAQDDSPLALDGLIYAGPAMREIVEQIHRTRAGHSPVLLTGERGTGKARLARAIHALSKRHAGPFESFACATLADAASAETRFGVAGVFAQTLARANDGTLHLADVEALPLDAQQQVLYVLQHGVFSPAGAAPVHADVRVIASTTQDLKALVRAGRFLEDLYYLLAVIPLHVPPLRERREAIPLLVRHFMNTLRPPGMPLPTLTNRAVEALLHYGWPGNVRQLRNEVERLLLLVQSEPAPLIDADDLAPDLLSAPTGVVPSELLAAAEEAILQPGHALDQVLAGTEKRLIERMLAEHAGQITASANALGLTRQGLYKKMKRLGIDAAGVKRKT